MLTLYTDRISHPARSVLLFLKSKNVDFVDKQVALFKGEHKGVADLPTGTVPTLIITADDGSKKFICQSTTILRYLAVNCAKDEAHWYEDPDVRFTVDEFFDYWQGTLNPAFIKTMRNKYFFKFALKKSEPDMDAVKECTEEYKKCLDFVKTHFMKGNKFLCGDKVSIGDMLLSSSLEQGKLLDEAYISTEFGTYLNCVKDVTVGYEELQNEAKKLPGILQSAGLL